MRKIIVAAEDTSFGQDHRTIGHEPPLTESAHHDTLSGDQMFKEFRALSV